MIVFRQVKDFLRWSVPAVRIVVAEGSAEQKMDVNAFLTTPAADTDVGGASAGPCKFVQIFSHAINRKRADG